MMYRQFCNALHLLLPFQRERKFENIYGHNNRTFHKYAFIKIPKVN